ncbi:LOW QUALITY PROTEIN: uncharacterized protein C8orf34 homolog [Brienomyrus brachyistius]|uniref:LOW QUALITY PROTEIN: uncharacterized protein C8orf34 homolog n=1 Tax=Brienomyrus brachyistius TaxID=42636 RepID=UPI0020B343AC|nr:LOW QUALITY PROTEIN: uncharacterized protein C8orf34 homolog [Brienomyrus brachyistius]
MASQHQSRIQFYLEKNRIGPLFEEMMTKLMAEMPDHPIPFLISHLQTKHSCSGKLYRTLSGSAALWAEPGSAESKGIRRDFRSNEKLWQTHPNKPKKSKSDLAVSNISPPSPDSKSLPRSVEHPNWDWGGCPESRDFDELNHILQESHKLGKALENLSRSIAVSVELDQDSGTFSGCLVRPRVVGQWAGREDEDADPLAAEMLQPPVPRSKTEGWQGEDSGPVGSLKVEPKSKGLKQQQQHHKKLLAAMLSQDSFESAPDSPAYIAEEDIEDEDEAMELLEDLDDLRMEGVTGLAPSGGRFSQGRGSSGSEPQAKVTLNICSRCARLQGDSLITKDGDGTGTGVRVHFVSPASCPSPGGGILTEAEAEPESALRVPGPRLPVWDSDLKSVKGKSSLTQKGLLLKDSLFAKELQSMEKHLPVAEKDLAKLSAGRLPHEAILLPHSAGPLSPLLGATPSPLMAGDPHSGRGARAQTPGCFPTPSGLVTWASFGSREEALVGHAGRPQLTPTGPSTTDALGKLGDQSGGLSEEEICHQLQAVRQPWLVPSDAESDHVESLPKDSRTPSVAPSAPSKKSLLSGL